jgi:hypothetical protein
MMIFGLAANATLLAISLFIIAITIDAKTYKPICICDTVYYTASGPYFACCTYGNDGCNRCFLTSNTPPTLCATALSLKTAFNNYPKYNISG